MYENVNPNLVLFRIEVECEKDLLIRVQFPGSSPLCKIQGVGVVEPVVGFPSGYNLLFAAFCGNHVT